VTRSWRGVLAIAAWQVSASATYYAVFAATSVFRETYDLSGFEVGLVVSVLTLGYTVFLFPMGAVVDAYGDRPAMVGGLVGLAAGTVGVVLSGTAESYLGLLVAVFALGAAYATGMPATNRAVAARAPRGRYNLAVGLKQVGVTLGSAVAAVLVTGLAARGFAWSAGFEVVAAAAVCVAAGFAVAYRGTSGTGTVSLPDLRGLAENRLLVVLAASGFFLGAAVFTTTGYAVPYTEDATNASRALAGGLLALMQVAGSVGRVGAGSIADRIPGTDAGASLRVLVVQTGVAGVLLVALPAVGRPGLVVAFAGLGLALLGFTGLYHGAVTALAPDGQSGAATAAAQLTLNVGGLLAPPTFGYVADTAGYATGWSLLGAGVLVSTLLVGGALRAAD